jgi:hypothetical protein
VRCYTSDGSKINRGFALADADGICAGNTRIAFTNGLSDSRLYRYNQRVDNCDVAIFRDDEIKLTAARDLSGNSRVLLLVDLVQPNGKIPAIDVQGEGTIFLSKTYHKYMGLQSFSTSPFDLFWTGLVELQEGSTLTITSENNYRRGNSFWHLIGLARRTNVHVVGFTVFSFEGGEVSLAHHWKVNGEHRKAGTLFPLI